MFNLRGVDLNLLTVFEALYELRSVRRAAERLSLSQAATSHALARLRHLCGDELFVRAGHQFVPTHVAQGFAPKAQEALRLLRQGLAATQGFDPASSERSFHISIPHPLGPLIAYRLRRFFANSAPNTTLSVDTRTAPPDLADNMRLGAVDLALDWLGIDLDQFVNKRALDEELLLVVRRDHPRIGAVPTLDEIRREEFVWLHPRHGSDLRRPKAADEIGRLDLRMTLRVSEWLEIPTLVATCDLLSIVPRSLASLLIRHLPLRVEPFPMHLTPVPIFVVWHAARRTDSAHRWLRDQVAIGLQQEANA
jgi:LysR family transcriptional regulator, transcriptional activator for leuABCD operon